MINIPEFGIGCFLHNTAVSSNLGILRVSKTNRIATFAAHDIQVDAQLTFDNNVSEETYGSIITKTEKSPNIDTNNKNETEITLQVKTEGGNDSEQKNNKIRNTKRWKENNGDTDDIFRNEVYNFLKKIQCTQKKDNMSITCNTHC